MALLVAQTDGFIQVSLDALLDLDLPNDLVALGLRLNAPNGLRVRKITFVPSAAGDTVYVRDGENGPIVFPAVNVLGTYDVLKDEYRDDNRIDKGKVMNPYVHANESVIAVAHNAFLIFEL